MSHLILSNQLKVEGFLVARWLKDWPAAFKEMSQWIQEVHIHVALSLLLYWLTHSVITP